MSLFIFSIKHCTILSNNVDHLLLNLTLSDIMVSLANASTLQKDSNWIEMIRKFVTETLEDGFRLNSKQLNRLLGVSWRLMQIQPNRGRCYCFVFLREELLCMLLGSSFELITFRHSMSQVNYIQAIKGSLYKYKGLST